MRIRVLLYHIRLSDAKGNTCERGQLHPIAADAEAWKDGGQGSPIALPIRSLNSKAIIYCSAKWYAIGLEWLTDLRYTASHNAGRPRVNLYDS